MLGLGRQVRIGFGGQGSGRRLGWGDLEGDLEGNRDGVGVGVRVRVGGRGRISVRVYLVGDLERDLLHLAQGQQRELPLLEGRLEADQGVLGGGRGRGLGG